MDNYYMSTKTLNKISRYPEHAESALCPHCCAAANGTTTTSSTTRYFEIFSTVDLPGMNVLQTVQNVPC